ncbi:MAG: aminopeptidase N [Halieaceae bacterium]|jgi:aminopeptidase N
MSAHLKFITAVSLMCIAALSCTNTLNTPNQAIGRQAKALLTEGDANARAQSVAGVGYSLDIDLTQSSTHFSGHVSITFDYTPGKEPLTIDFDGGEVLSLEIDGNNTSYQYNGLFISLDPAALPPGQNQINISFRHPYSDGAGGFYRFEDPADGRVYTYTDFEPYHANHLFPLFDQPDLKASFTLEVTAPGEWTVVSTTRETTVEETGKNKRWKFPPTASIASYVFSLHAGEYAVWEDASFRYPLRLFSRQSTAQFVNADEWFRITRDGFDFYDDYFNFPYPFEKYDQLLVPEYPQGAMENVGAVTFNEGYLSRSEPTWAERRELALTIFHEQAHMWFGNTSTMRWWNGLWLNESFASYTAYLGLVEATEFSDAWEHFYAREKKGAYRADDSITTHAIELVAANTDEAVSNFDSITYGKGASVLKQIHHMLGDEVFQAGIVSYLGDNAFANTELEDFTDALGEAANMDLTEWSQQWLYQPGLNRIEASYSCQHGAIRKLRIRQSAPKAHPTLRQQRLQLASYQNQDGALTLVDSFVVDIAGELTEVSTDPDSPCPDLFYPNYHDWGYAQVNLDARSLNTLRHHINSIEEPMLRTMLWNDLWTMVRNAELAVTDYLQILAANLGAEEDSNVLGGLLRTLESSFDYLHLGSHGEEPLARYAPKFERMLWRKVTESESDMRKLWLASYIEIAESAEARSRLREILSAGDDDLLKLNQRQRWQVLYRLGESGAADIEALLAAELGRDPSDLGQRRTLSTRVANPDAAGKLAFLKKMLDRENELSLAERRTIAYALFPPRQRYLAAEAGAYVLANLPEISAEQHAKFLYFIAAFLPQKLCTPASVKDLATAVENYPNLSHDLVKGLKLAHQADTRCVAIDNKMAPTQR